MVDEIVTAPLPPAKPARIIDRIGVPEIVDLTLIFGLLTIIFLWIVFKPDPNNQLLTAIITGWMAMTSTIVGYHRGSSSGSKSKDESQTKMVEMLTGTEGPGPKTPSPLTPAVTPWWTSLTDQEKTDITTAAATDPRAAAFIATASTGNGSADDLAYLVSKGLLTQDRATAIQGA